MYVKLIVFPTKLSLGTTMNLKENIDDRGHFANPMTTKALNHFFFVATNSILSFTFI